MPENPMEMLRTPRAVRDGRKPAAHTGLGGHVAALAVPDLKEWNRGRGHRDGGEENVSEPRPRPLPLSFTPGRWLSLRVRTMTWNSVSGSQEFEAVQFAKDRITASACLSGYFAG